MRFKYYDLGTEINISDKKVFQWECEAYSNKSKTIKEQTKDVIDEIWDAERFQEVLDDLGAKDFDELYDMYGDEHIYELFYWTDDLPEEDYEYIKNEHLNDAEWRADNGY